MIKKKEPDEEEAFCPRCYSTNVACTREERLGWTVLKHICLKCFHSEKQEYKGKGPDSCPLTHKIKVLHKKVRFRKVRPQNEAWKQSYPQQEL